MYGEEHYVISSVSDANKHLSSTGKMQVICDAGILLDVMQSADDESLHAFRSISESLFKPFDIDEFGTLAVGGTSTISQFPFSICKYEGEVAPNVASTDVNIKYLLSRVKSLADRIGGLEQSDEYQAVVKLLTQDHVTNLAGEMAMLELRSRCRESMTFEVLSTATTSNPIDLTCFIKNPNITQNLLDASGNPNNASVDGWTCVACADGHARTEATSGDTWLYCYSWSGKDFLRQLTLRRALVSLVEGRPQCSARRAGCGTAEAPSPPRPSSS